MPRPSPNPRPSGRGSGLNLLSDVIVLERTNEDVLFTHPVAVVVPYDTTKAQNNDMIAVYEFDLETGRIDGTTMIDHDPEAGTVSFMTTHFSYYIVVELLDTFNELITNGYDSGFRPSSDGWFITNWGAYITDGGNCLGMSAMAKYLYAYQNSGDSTFYSRYRQGDLDEEMDDVIAQELAARNQLSLTNRWNELTKDMDRYESELGVSLGTSASARKQGEIILMNLRATGEPQVLYVTQLFTNNTWGAAHAVLVYKYADGYFYIYDPNYPYRSAAPDSSVKKLKFDASTGFGLYDSSTSAGAPGLKFNVIYHLGTSFVTDRHIMAGLWNKALSGFSDDEFPDITFSSPEEGAVITDKSVVVTGTVQGGNYTTQAGEKFLHWYYQNEKGGLEYIRSAVGTDGSFTQELPVIPGTNHVNVLAAGKQPTDEWAGFATLTIDASIQAADMLVTLTWDAGQSDIDLHVTDPNGYHVWYSDKNAPTGAQLDFDNTRGYGPEHYTISSDEGDEMPYGDYSVDVVYYADHDDNYDSVRRVPYTVQMQWVKAVLPDETKIWESVTRSGALTQVSQNNHVYTISHVEPTIEDYGIDANPFGVE